MNRDQKAAVVEEIAGQIEAAEAVFAVDYRGISVAQVAELRSKLRDADAKFRIVKNSLTERAADKAGAEALRHLVELRTDDAATYTPGQEVRADVFAPGDTVDVVGVSKGKGFTGVMKRHGFSGLKSSHGVEKKHRSPGSIGACATPSRVFKGMRMAGQSGNQRVTVLNLEVVRSDPERGLLLVKGAVPGPNGGLLMVRSAVKTPVRKGA